MSLLLHMHIFSATELTLDEGDVYPPSVTGGANNGDHMWDKFISKHKNIVLVISGHDPCEDIVVTQTKGENGNIVTQMLVDPQGVDAAQGATGLVAILYFSEDGSKVDVEYYSTVRDAYYKTSNQFKFDLAVVDPNAKTPPTPTTPTTPDTGKNGFEFIIIAIIAMASLFVVVKMKRNSIKSDHQQ